MSYFIRTLYYLLVGLIAAKAVMFKISSTEDLIVTICTDFSKPVKIGPITEHSLNSSSNLVAILAECNPGQIKILASSVKRQKGYFALFFFIKSNISCHFTIIFKINMLFVQNNYRILNSFGFCM